MDVTCVCPYKSASRALQHSNPDGEPIFAARMAEALKETRYSEMCRESLDFIPLAYDVFGGSAPKADEFLHQMASLAVRKHFGVSEGPEFSVRFSAILGKWKARLSTVLQREVANCLIEGARNARGGDRVDPTVSDGLFHLFEPVLPDV